MSSPTTIVFDLDGTLIDSRGDIVAAVNYALTQSGREPLPAPVIVGYVGDGARALCARAAELGEMDEEVDYLVRLFIKYYVQHPVDFTRWTPGAQEALEALSVMPDTTLAICTNKPRATTDAVLAALGVLGRFRAVVAGGDVAEKKPAPGPLLHVAKLLRVQPETMVMVGDGPQDIECARRANVRSIAVDGGFCTEARLRRCQPDALLHSLRELPEVIQRWREPTMRMVVQAEKIR
jgi:phosphoglycolate phosphatase